MKKVLPICFARTLAAILNVDLVMVMRNGRLMGSLKLPRRMKFHFKSNKQIRSSETSKLTDSFLAFQFYQHILFQISK